MPSLNCQECEWVKNMIKQEVQGSSIKERDHILRTTNPPKDPTLTSLNDIIMDDVNYQPQQPSPNDCIASLMIVNSNITTVEHSTKLSGHTTTKSYRLQTMTAKNQMA